MRVPHSVSTVVSLQNTENTTINEIHTSRYCRERWRWLVTPLDFHTDMHTHKHAWYTHVCMYTHTAPGQVSWKCGFSSLCPAQGGSQPSRDWTATVMEVSRESFGQCMLMFPSAEANHQMLASNSEVGVPFVDLGSAFVSVWALQ